MKRSSLGRSPWMEACSMPSAFNCSCTKEQLALVLQKIIMLPPAPFPATQLSPPALLTVPPPPPPLSPLSPATAGGLHGVCAALRRQSRTCMMSPSRCSRRTCSTIAC